MVTVTYERQSLTRGFTNSNLTEEPIRILVRWLCMRGGRSREVVAYERWLLREVPLYDENFPSPKKCTREGWCRHFNFFGLSN